LNPFLQNTLRSVEKSTQDAARKLVWQILLGLSGCLVGLAALGFLTASAFLTLSTAVGPELAALFVGIGLVFLAVGLLALALRPRINPNVVDTPIPPPEASGAEVPNIATTVAFTAAFVLARYFNSSEPD
jgi:membrane-associated phospholipid phosphatase